MERGAVSQKVALSALRRARWVRDKAVSAGAPPPRTLVHLPPRLLPSCHHRAALEGAVVLSTVRNEADKRIKKNKKQDNSQTGVGGARHTLMSGLDAADLDRGERGGGGGGGRGQRQPQLPTQPGCRGGGTG
jgi:hypothetical protein